MEFDGHEVKEARGKEIQYIREKQVWSKIGRRQALANGWKIIKTRWIDINKGDDVSPVYRSRLVGKEFNTGDMEGIFAGTHPLEALRCILHEAATIREEQDTHTTRSLWSTTLPELFSKHQRSGRLAWNCPRKTNQRTMCVRIKSGT